MTDDAQDTEFDRQAATTAWDRLLTEYAAARADADLDPQWVALVTTVTGVDADQVEEQVHGNVPQPNRPRASDGVVVEVMNGVSDVVVRLCADVVLYGDAEPADLVAQARQINDRYCDLYDLVVARHPAANFDDPDEPGDAAEVAEEPAELPPAAARTKKAPSERGAPWQQRTGSPVDGRALGGLVQRLVTAYATRADVATLEAMWRSAFGAASGCDAAVISEVCESARLPERQLPEARAANEVAAGFEELFATAVVRLFAPDSSGNGDLADESRRLVQRRDALFDLIEELYPGMYDDADVEDVETPADRS